ASSSDIDWQRVLGGIPRAACEAAGIEIDVVGAGVGTVVDDLPERLRSADIVFASARMAIEAMAVGCAVVVVDGRGLAGLATTDALGAWRLALGAWRLAGRELW